MARRFDEIGALVLAAALLGYTLAMTIGWDHPGALNAGLLAAAVGLVTGASGMGTIFTVFVGGQEMAGASGDAIAFGMRAIFAAAALTLVAFDVGAGSRRSSIFQTRR